MKNIVNIPSKSLEELAKILDDSHDLINMYLIDKTVLFVYKNISFLTRLVEGNYPDTSSLFPKQQLLTVKFKKHEKEIQKGFRTKRRKSSRYEEYRL